MDKILLAEWLDYQAAWRTMKAEEYPEDDRNASSAHALFEAAAYARTMADDDPRLVVLYGVESPVLGQEASRLASRYGFDERGPGYSEDEFIADLLAAVERDLAAEEAEGECIRNEYLAMEKPAGDGTNGGGPVLTCKSETGSARRVWA